MAQPFEMRTDPDGVLWLSGEVDLAVVDRVLAAADEHVGRSDLVVDLSEVTFVDSAGLAAIIELGLRTRCPMVLRSPSPLVRRLLELVRLEGHGGIRIVD